jgi:hypothetical protein
MEVIIVLERLLLTVWESLITDQLDRILPVDNCLAIVVKERYLILQWFRHRSAEIAVSHSLEHVFALHLTVSLCLGVQKLELLACSGIGMMSRAALLISIRVVIIIIVAITTLFLRVTFVWPIIEEKSLLVIFWLK